MLPKKVKELLPLVADMNQYNLDLVTSINTFFWETTRKILSEAPETTIHIANLGNFYIKHWVLDDKLKKYNDIKTNTLKRRCPNPYIIQSADEKLTTINNLKEYIEKEAQRKEFVKLHRQKLDNEKDSDTDLGE